MSDDAANATEPSGSPLVREVMALPPERAAFEAWFAAFQDIRADFKWAAWKGCRDDCLADLERTAEHMRENAEALRKYPGMEQEARARELAACNVDSIARLWRLERQMTEFHERHNVRANRETTR